MAADQRSVLKKFGRVVRQIFLRLPFVNREAYLRRIVDDPVLALALGGIHGAVGLLQKLFGIGRVVGEDADADTGADLDFMTLHSHGIGDSLEQVHGHQRGVFLGKKPVQDHQEFIAAQPRQQVSLANPRAQAGGHLHQQRVAHLVPKAVVHLFEAIQVDIKQRKNALFSSCTVHQHGDLLHQESPVGQAGERIVVRLMNRRVPGLLQLGLFLSQQRHINGRRLVDDALRQRSVSEEDGYYAAAALGLFRVSAPNGTRNRPAENSVAVEIAAVQMLASADPAAHAACAIIKHANPCGVALGANLTEAYQKALSIEDPDNTDGTPGSSPQVQATLSVLLAVAGATTTDSRITAAFIAAQAALSKPECASLFNVGHDANVPDPQTLLAGIMSGLDGKAYFTFGDLGPPVNGWGKNAITMNTGYAMDPDGTVGFTGVANKVVVVFNSNRGVAFNNGNVTDNATTLLHELGHVYESLYGLGSTYLVDDDGSRNASTVNTKWIQANCF